MQSFSAFKPVLSGTPSEIKTSTFAMWLRANAANLRRPFDRVRWRTSRPWLTFAEVRYQLKLHRDRSLGSLVLGNVILLDKDVEQAVKYEAYATRNVSLLDVQTMIFNFYDFCRTARTLRTEVLANINREFSYLGRGVVKPHSLQWRNTITKFRIGKFLMLKPKMDEHKLATVIWHVFKPSEKKLTHREVFDRLAPTLNAVGQVIHEHSPLLRRALQITSYNLEYLNKREMVEKVVERYYEPYELGCESLKRLKFVVNFVVHIKHDDPVWNFIDLKIVPKHDWNLPGYEQAFSEEFDDPPDVSEEQEPFMRYRLPFSYIRKKQTIPWKLIIEKCKRKGGTDKATLYYSNLLLESMGFVPMSFCHPAFNILKVQGLRLDTESFHSYFPERQYLPFELLEKPGAPRILYALPGGVLPGSSPWQISSHSTDTCESSPCSEKAHDL